LTRFNTIFYHLVVVYFLRHPVYRLEKNWTGKFSDNSVKWFYCFVRSSAHSPIAAWLSDYDVGLWLVDFH